MRMKMFMILGLMFVMVMASCASIPRDRYNTQKGAAIGAGAGALIGQAIGHNTKGTLIGLTAGTILGALVGIAVDKGYIKDVNQTLLEFFPEKTIVNLDERIGPSRSNTC